MYLQLSEYVFLDVSPTAIMAVVGFIVMLKMIEAYYNRDKKVKEK